MEIKLSDDIFNIAREVLQESSSIYLKDFLNCVYSRLENEYDVSSALDIMLSNINDLVEFYYENKKN